VKTDAQDAPVDELAVMIGRRVGRVRKNASELDHYLYELRRRTGRDTPEALARLVHERARRLFREASELRKLSGVVFERLVPDTEEDTHDRDTSDRGARRAAA
jgi:hypothetical protein